MPSRMRCRVAPGFRVPSRYLSLSVCVAGLTRRRGQGERLRADVERLAADCGRLAEAKAALEAALVPLRPCRGTRKQFRVLQIHQNISGRFRAWGMG